MKEAAGEANLTVVTIILIAAIVAIVTPIVTSMMKNTGKKTCCMNAGGYWKGSLCYDTNNSQISESTYWDSKNGKCTQ